MHKFTKKRIAIGALGLLVVAGAAVAYFTTTGSGEGSATVGTTEAITVTPTTVGNLYPLNTAPAKNTTIKLKNTTKGVVKVKEVEKSEVTVAESGTGEPHEGCSAEWFKFSPVAFNEELEPNEEKTKEGTLWLKNEHVNQDACKGAAVTVKYTVVSE